MGMFKGVHTFHVRNWLSSRRSDTTPNQRNKKRPPTDVEPNSSFVGAPQFSGSSITSTFIVNKQPENAQQADIPPAIEPCVADSTKQKTDRQNQCLEAVDKQVYKNDTKLQRDCEIKVTSQDVKKNSKVATANKYVKGTSINVEDLPLAKRHPKLVEMDKRKQRTTPSRIDYCTLEETIMLRKALIELLSKSARHLFEFSTDDLEMTEATSHLPRLQSFIERLITITRLPLHTICTALLYLLRLKEKHPDAQGGYGTAHRLALIALILANKYVDDYSFGLSTWHHISRRWFTHSDIVIMEAEFLSRIDYRLEVTRSTWHEFVSKIELRLDTWRRREKIADTCWPLLSQAVGLWEAMRREWPLNSVLGNLVPTTAVSADAIAARTAAVAHPPIAVPCSGGSTFPTPVSNEGHSSITTSSWSFSSVCSSSPQYYSSTSAGNIPSVTSHSYQLPSYKSTDSANSHSVHPGGVHKFKRNLCPKRYRSAPISMHLAYQPSGNEISLPPSSIAMPQPIPPLIFPMKAQHYPVYLPSYKPRVDLSVPDLPRQHTEVPSKFISLSSLPSELPVHLPSLMTVSKAAPLMASNTGLATHTAQSKSPHYTKVPKPSISSLPNSSEQSFRWLH